MKRWILLSILLVVLFATASHTQEVVIRDRSGNVIGTINDGNLPVHDRAGTSGGCTISSIISAATVNETAVKATAGQVYSVSAFSLDATPVYLKFYNATAANTDENATPVLRMMIPANSTATLGSGFISEWPTGLSFSTAITYRATTGIADNDAGALSANEVLINVCYK